MVRRPAVAGRFYPSEPDALAASIRDYLESVPQQAKAIGCVVPHAGYMYSGHVAGAVYARLDLPERYIILCPNHTGYGHRLAIMSEGTWLTPLGEVPVDAPLAQQLKAEMPELTDDIDSQLQEHALEVQ